MAQATAEQVQAVLDEVKALRAEMQVLSASVDNKLKWDNPLVGDGVQRPKAPTSAEVAMDPRNYYGTPFDPLPSSLHINSMTIIERFESTWIGPEPNPNRFVGGTIGEWFRRDPDAALRFLADSMQGHKLNLNSLHPAQRKVLFG